MKKLRFNNHQATGLSLSEIISDIDYFIKQEPNKKYRVVIGTDSQTKRINGVTEIDYVTAVVVYREGKGARYFWTKEKYKGKHPVLRDKIYKEALMSIDFAQKFSPMIKDKIVSSNYNLEIHVDIGKTGSTKNMIAEIVGMVNGNGFNAKTKPESWGASSVADRHA